MCVCGWRMDGVHGHKAIERERAAPNAGIISRAYHSCLTVALIINIYRCLIGMRVVFYALFATHMGCSTCAAYARHHAQLNGWLEAILVPFNVSASHRNTKTVQITLAGCIVCMVLFVLFNRIAF